MAQQPVSAPVKERISAAWLRLYEKIATWADQALSGMAGDKTMADLATALSEFNPPSNDLEGVLEQISGSRS
jgi:hypothetical protein